MDIAIQVCYTLFTGVTRLFPIPFNFSPVYSYSSYIFVNNKRSYISSLLMIVLLIITDFILSLMYDGYPFPGWYCLYVYPIHLMNGYLAKYIIKENDQIINIGVTCSLTSMNFFFLSNLGYFFVN
jgi:hypothetical protein